MSEDLFPTTPQPADRLTAARNRYAAAWAAHAKAAGDDEAFDGFGVMPELRKALKEATLELEQAEEAEMKRRKK